MIAVKKNLIINYHCTIYFLCTCSPQELILLVSLSNTKHNYTMQVYLSTKIWILIPYIVGLRLYLVSFMKCLGD